MRIVLRRLFPKLYASFTSCKCSDEGKSQCRGQIGGRLALLELLSRPKLPPHKTIFLTTLLFTMASLLESDPVHSQLRYQPAHALLAIRQGSRCRVCARVYAANHSAAVGGFCGVHVCNAYRLDGHNSWAFVVACCRLQDEFVADRRQRQPSCQRLPGQTESEFWWWEMVTILQLQCEVSLVNLGPMLERALLLGWDERTFMR